ncbi:MAG: DUF5009 domain-containing protein [Elusimicrobia bacterium]|nr:DUF5009 domain-containing protein [Elusimicrobiota bacterium]
MSAAGAGAPAIPPSERLLSLDVLRGFDMFWIVGAGSIVHALDAVGAGGWVRLLSNQLRHKDWAGFAFLDLVFPLFVFIVGVSLVFSLEKIVGREGRPAALKRVWTRSLTLFLLGVFYSGGLAGGLAGLRIMGVLQRIALCYLFCSLLVLSLKPRALAAVFVGLLAGYWALLTFVPVPGAGAGDFREGMNLANYVDKLWLPFSKYDGDHDPEGLLSTLPALASCLFGVFAGMLLRARDLSPQKKVHWLAGCGAAALALGLLWGLQFPVIKKIWTSSYVLVAGGWSCILLAAFYQVVDIWKVRAWTAPFVWIGVNPIAIYMACNVVDFQQLARRVLGGPIQGGLGPYGDLLIAGAGLGLVLMLARFLHERKLYLRV